MLILSFLTQSESGSDVVQGTADVKQEILNQSCESSIGLTADKFGCWGQQIDLCCSCSDRGGDGLDVGDEGRSGSSILSSSRIGRQTGCGGICRYQISYTRKGGRLRNVLIAAVYCWTSEYKESTML